MNAFKIKITAQACIIRYDRGETNLSFIIDSYNLALENRTLVEANIMTLRTDIQFGDVE